MNIQLHEKEFGHSLLVKNGDWFGFCFNCCIDSIFGNVMEKRRSGLDLLHRYVSSAEHCIPLCNVYSCILQSLILSRFEAFLEDGYSKDIGHLVQMHANIAPCENDFLHFVSHCMELLADLQRHLSIHSRTSLVEKLKILMSVVSAYLHTNNCTNFEAYIGRSNTSAAQYTNCVLSLSSSEFHNGERDPSIMSLLFCPLITLLQIKDCYTVFSQNNQAIIDVQFEYYVLIITCEVLPFAMSHCKTYNDRECLHNVLINLLHLCFKRLNERSDRRHSNVDSGSVDSNVVLCRMLCVILQYCIVDSSTDFARGVAEYIAVNVCAVDSVADGEKVSVNRNTKSHRRMGSNHESSILYPVFNILLSVALQMQSSMAIPTATSTEIRQHVSYTAEGIALIADMLHLLHDAQPGLCHALCRHLLEEEREVNYVSRLFFVYERAVIRHRNDETDATSDSEQTSVLRTLALLLQIYSKTNSTAMPALFTSHVVTTLVSQLGSVSAGVCSLCARQMMLARSRGYCTEETPSLVVDFEHYSQMYEKQKQGYLFEIVTSLVTLSASSATVSILNAQSIPSLLGAKSQLQQRQHHSSLACTVLTTCCEVLADRPVEFSVEIFQMSMCALLETLLPVMWTAVRAVTTVPQPQSSKSHSESDSRSSCHILSRTASTILVAIEIMGNSCVDESADGATRFYKVAGMLFCFLDRLQKEIVSALNSTSTPSTQSLCGLHTHVAHILGVLLSVDGSLSVFERLNLTLFDSCSSSESTVCEAVLSALLIKSSAEGLSLNHDRYLLKPLVVHACCCRSLHCALVEVVVVREMWRQSHRVVHTAHDDKFISLYASFLATTLHHSIEQGGGNTEDGVCMVSSQALAQSLQSLLSEVCSALADSAPAQWQQQQDHSSYRYGNHPDNHHAPPDLNTYHSDIDMSTVAHCIVHCAVLSPTRFEGVPREDMLGLSLFLVQCLAPIILEDRALQTACVTQQERQRVYVPLGWTELILYLADCRGDTVDYYTKHDILLRWLVADNVLSQFESRNSSLQPVASVSVSAPPSHLFQRKFANNFQRFAHNASLHVKSTESNVNSSYYVSHAGPAVISFLVISISEHFVDGVARMVRSNMFPHQQLSTPHSWRSFQHMRITDTHSQSRQQSDNRGSVATIDVRVCAFLSQCLSRDSDSGDTAVKDLINYWRQTDTASLLQVSADRVDGDCSSVDPDETHSYVDAEQDVVCEGGGIKSLSNSRCENRPRSLGVILLMANTLISALLQHISKECTGSEYQWKVHEDEHTTVRQTQCAATLRVISVVLNESLRHVAVQLSGRGVSEVSNVSRDLIDTLFSDQSGLSPITVEWCYWLEQLHALLTGPSYCGVKATELGLECTHALMIMLEMSCGKLADAHCSQRVEKIAESIIGHVAGLHISDGINTSTTDGVLHQVYALRTTLLCQQRSRSDTNKLYVGIFDSSSEWYDFIQSNTTSATAKHLSNDCDSFPLQLLLVCEYLRLLSCAEHDATCTVRNSFSEYLTQVVNIYLLERCAADAGRATSMAKSIHVVNSQYEGANQVERELAFALVVCAAQLLLVEVADSGGGDAGHTSKQQSSPSSLRMFRVLLLICQEFCLAYEYNDLTNDDGCDSPAAVVTLASLFLACKDSQDSEISMPSVMFDRVRRLVYRCATQYRVYCQDVLSVSLGMHQPFGGCLWNHVNSNTTDGSSLRYVSENICDIHSIAFVMRRCND